MIQTGSLRKLCAYNQYSMRRRVFPNCIARVKGNRQAHIGSTVLQCLDLSSLTARRPIERGYLVNADLQSEIWAHSFANLLSARASDSSLLLTEPPLNLPSIHESVDQVRLA